MVDVWMIEIFKIDEDVFDEKTTPSSCLQNPA